MKANAQSGFTLVELAIVLMIIGLLIGGVLRGQEMMENARIGQMIKQIKSYEAALVTFQDTYNAMPGDIRNPSARIPNCAAGTDCGSGGNGDGLIGPYRGPGYPSIVMTTGREEPRTAWLQMASAHLITGIKQDEPFTDVAYGKQFPATPWGEGGFQIVTYTSPNGFNLATGSVGNGSQGTAGVHLFITNSRPNVVTFSHGDMFVDSGNVTAPLTPHAAAMIDRKIDDGTMYSGSVQAAGPSCQGGTGWSAVPYNEAHPERACAMVISIQ